MSDLQESGTIKSIGEKQTFDSGFYKREFVVETLGEYPQLIKFEITKEKSDKFVEFNNVGDLVRVKFNIRGNEWNDKVYNTLEAWRVEKLEDFKGIKPQVEELTSTEDDIPF